MLDFANIFMSSMPGNISDEPKSTVKNLTQQTQLTPIAAHPAFRKTKCLFYVSHFRSHYSLFLSYNRSWGRGWDPVKPV